MKSVEVQSYTKTEKKSAYFDDKWLNLIVALINPYKLVLWALNSRRMQTIPYISLHRLHQSLMTYVFVLDSVSVFAMSSIAN